MAEWLNDLSVGSWFEVEGGTFEIVGIDAKSGVVLVQHFDGTLDDIEFDDWLGLNAKSCAPPEDVRGAFDLEPDEVFDEPPCHLHLGQNPVEAFTLGLDDSM